MAVFHDEVEIEDFQYDEDSETYFYPCPCGDNFCITKVATESSPAIRSRRAFPLPRFCHRSARLIVTHVLLYSFLNSPEVDDSALSVGTSSGLVGPRWWEGRVWMARGISLLAIHLRIHFWDTPLEEETCFCLPKGFEATEP